MFNVVIVVNDGIGFVLFLLFVKLVIYKLKFDIFYFLQLICVDIIFFDFMNFFLSGELIVLELFEKFLLLVDFYKCVLEVLGIKVWVEKCLKIDY